MLAGLALRRPLLVILTLALIFRVGFILNRATDEQIYDSLYDQYVYVDLAKSLASGHGYSLSHDVFIASGGYSTSIEPPVYPLVLVVLFGIFGHHLFAVRLFNVVVGSLLCGVIYLIAKSAFDRRVGLWAGVLTAVYPLLVMYVRPIMPEPLYALLVSLIVLLLLHVLTTDALRASYFLIWGLLAGIAFLTRAESLGLSLLTFGFGIWILGRREARLGRVAARMLLGLCGFALIAGSWGIRNWVAQGSFHLLPTKRYVLWDLNWLRYQREIEPEWRDYVNAQYYAIPRYDRLSELERDKYLQQLVMDFVRQHPVTFAKYAITRVANAYPVVPREMLPPPIGYQGVRERPVDEYGYDSLDDYPLYFRPAEKLRVWSFRLVFSCALLAAVVLIKQRKRDVLLVIILPLCFNVASSALFVGTERLRSPFDPYLIVLASYTVVIAADRCRQWLSTLSTVSENVVL